MRIEIKISTLFGQDFVIKDLKPFTQYVVSLAVRNPQGVGPASTVVVMTDEGGIQRYILLLYSYSI